MLKKSGLLLVRAIAPFVAHRHPCGLATSSEFRVKWAPRLPLFRFAAMRSSKKCDCCNNLCNNFTGKPKETRGRKRFQLMPRGQDMRSIAVVLLVKTGSYFWQKWVHTFGCSGVKLWSKISAYFRQKWVRTFVQNWSHDFFLPY